MLTDIRLQNFRSYQDSAYDLDLGVNIIVGPNASGKTNLLEAILMVNTARSYRARANEQIRFKRNWARLDVHTKTEDIRTLKLKLSHDSKADKSFEINGKLFKRLPLAQNIPTVLFEPQHLLLLTAGPDVRRDYLDELLEQTILGYSQTLAAYKRSLIQRNRLLKKSTSKDAELFPWNVRLSELGGQLVEARTNLASKLNSQIGDLYQKLSKSQAKLDVKYVSRLGVNNYATNLLKKLEDSVELDKIRGFTGHGPHRDDIDIEIDNHKAQLAASRGEVRTIVLALKILELNLLEDIRQTKPILLLDDVFSELDGARRKSLTTYLKDYQTFITTTDADVVIHNFAQKCHIIGMS